MAAFPRSSSRSSAAHAPAHRRRASPRATWGRNSRRSRWGIRAAPSLRWHPAASAPVSRAAPPATARDLLRKGQPALSASSSGMGGAHRSRRSSQSHRLSDPDSGETICVDRHRPGRLPAIVTWPGSPPKAAMLSRTSAARRSDPGNHSSLAAVRRLGVKLRVGEQAENVQPVVHRHGDDVAPKRRHHSGIRTVAGNEAAAVRRPALAAVFALRPGVHIAEVEAVLTMPLARKFMSPSRSATAWRRGAKARVCDAGTMIRLAGAPASGDRRTGGAAKGMPFEAVHARAFHRAKIRHLCR